MAVKHTIKRVIVLTLLPLILVQCQTVGNSLITPTQNVVYEPAPPSVTPIVTSSQAINTEPVNNTNSCHLPPIQISNLNIRWFYWSEDSEAIFFKVKNSQTWYSYNIISGQTNVATTTISITSTPEYTDFNIGKFQDAFISPSGRLVVFTRGSHDDYELYYKTLDKMEEHYLGTIHGVVERVDCVIPITNWDD